MKLALSVRVAESFRDKHQAVMPLDALADLAAAEGYQGICMRASQLGVQTPLAEVRQASRRLADRGLAVSMVTGDFAVPENSAQGPGSLRQIGPSLDLAEALGADLLRICMKDDEDIAWAQRAADEAAARGLRLAHQCHTSSLFEQVDRFEQVLAQIGRENFGLIYEPANLDACGQDYGPATIKRLAPHLFNVYVQNHRSNPTSRDVLTTWCRGEFRFDQIPLWSEGGLDFAPIMKTLQEIGYDGYVTVHQASATLGTQEAVQQSARYLRTLAEFENRCD